MTGDNPEARSNRPIPREPDPRVVRATYAEMLERGFRFNFCTERASLHVVEDLLRSAYQREAAILPEGLDQELLPLNR